MKTKLEDKDFIIEIINKNRRNGGVSLIIPILWNRFDRSITKDATKKISSLLDLSITQEATYPLV